MELYWYCTGAVGMKQQGCWGVLWVSKRPPVNPLERQRNRQHDIWCLITNTWANRFVMVSSVITRYLTLANTGQSPFPLQFYSIHFQCISISSLFVVRLSAVIYQLLFEILPIVFAFTFICFCSITSNSASVLFHLFCLIIHCLIIQCHFLFWYWNCIPDIWIHRAAYHQPSGKSINIIHKSAPSFVLV